MNRDLLLALRHAIESAPHSAEAHLRLGTALLEEGAPRAAERELRAAVELDPRCAGAWVNLGGILFSRWDFAAALEANRRAAEADPTLALAHFNQGLAHLQLGEPEAALDGLHRAIALAPRSGAVYHHLAIALHALERPLEAQVCSAYARELGYSSHARAGPLEREGSTPTPQGERHGTAEGQ